MRLHLRLIAFTVIIFQLAFHTLQAQEAGKKGTLAGKITDSKSGEDIIGATVAIEGTTIGASTDLDGKYFLKLEPGTYTVVVSYVSYKSKKLEGVLIKAGELNSFNITLAEDSKELDEIVVVGEARKESAAGLLLQQKNAVAVSSGISADLIRKMPDRTTADVIKRVSGASIQDGKFAIIRGLGDRYNYGMINGAPLPSSESDRKAFSLDIVPAQVVDNITIIKTATPDMPGDFAGGLIKINTRDIPDENLRFINVGIGGHSLTTFKNFNYSPQSSGTDWLGFDNGPRQIPNGALPFETSKNLDPVSDGQTIGSQTNLFNNNFKSQSATARPNYSFQLGISQRGKFFGNDIGVIAALTYNNVLRNTPSSLTTNAQGLETAKSSSEVLQKRQYDLQGYRNQVNIGGILNLSYKIGANNKFAFKNLITQNSDDQTSLRTTSVKGNSINSNGDTLLYRDYFYLYNSNRMISSQFNAEHFNPATKIKINYTVGYNNLYRNVPDYKRLFYQEITRTDTELLAVLSQDPKTYTPQSSGRFFSTLSEYSYSGNLDVSMPFYLGIKHDVKVGGMYQYRSRDFNARNFLYGYRDYSSVVSLISQGPDAIFAPQNIAGDKIFQRESTQKQDKYSANSTLYAGFVMMESKFSTSFRAVYGVRVESFNQQVFSTDASGDKNVNKTWTDPLPSVNLIYGVTEKTNLRFSYARTLSRPEFREFTQFAFYDFNTNATIRGNNDLTRALVDNIDLKYEFYPAPGSTLSINPFYKKFSNPVIVTNESGGGPDAPNSFSYANAKSAVNFGVELEARVKLTAIDKVWSTDFFKDLTVYGNLALIYSEQNLSNIPRLQGTNLEKGTPLQGQSPYVFNAGIQYSNEKTGWDFAISGNQVGRRIANVGFSKNFLIWENPRFILDFSVTKTIKKLQLRGIAGDMLAQDLVFYYDVNQNGVFDNTADVTAFKYRNGQTVTLQAIYNF